MELHIGIDDTDSVDGMCTTYLGAVLKDKLSKFSTVLESRLVRLNPNVEFKTRGNAGISLRIETQRMEDVKNLVLETVEKYAVFEDKNTNPGVVFLEGDVPHEFCGIYRRALHEIVPIKDVERVALEYGAEVHKFKNGRGIIGAVAAIGSDMGDHTYEIIAYRHMKNWGAARNIDKESVIQMDKKTYPLTFNNVDPADDCVLVAPHSPCPVLFGIRGENSEVLHQAYSMVDPGEPVERTMIYTTNQGTDAHLEEVSHIKDIKPYSSVILKGTVSGGPETITGGHVIFSISDGRDVIDCAAYEPTGNFRWIIRDLRVGDELKVSGGVKSDTINLEKIEVLKLKEIIKEENPLCPSCNARMKSAGKDQGFRCKKCKSRADAKIKTHVQRKLEEKIYQVPPMAMRHLSKPLVRY